MRSKSKRRNRGRLQWITAIVIAYWCLLFISTHIPLQLPGGQGSDKWMHFFAYGGLAWLAAWAFSQKKELTPPQLFAVWGIVSTYGIVDELLQLIPAMNRSADVMDWLADTAGAACAVILFALFARMQRALRGQVTVF